MRLLKSGKLRKEERSIELELRTLLELKGARTYKTDTFAGVKIQYPNGRGERNFNEGIVGQQDFVALWPSPDNLHIEVKADDGELSVEQKVYHEVLRKEGRHVLLAHCWADVQRWIDEHRSKR